MEQNIRFQERQYFRQWWIALFVLIVALPQWAAFIVQIIFKNPAGTNPAPDAAVILFWLVFGIGLPLLFLLFHMDTIVTDQELIIRFAPIINRRIPLSSIEKVEARQYRPLWDYGGWGIRWGTGGKRAYNVK